MNLKSERFVQLTLLSFRDFKDNIEIFKRAQIKR
jgi:hypothetical protein